MHSAVLALKDKFDEVSVGPTEVLETTVSAIRTELKEFKADHREHRAEFRAAITRIDNDIETSAIRLETEIRAMAAKAQQDLQRFADRTDTQFAELRAEQKSLREKVDGISERLDVEIDRNSERLDTTFEKLDAKFDTLAKIVLRIDSHLSAMQWAGGGLVAFVTVTLTAGKALDWF